MMNNKHFFGFGRFSQDEPFYFAAPVGSDILNFTQGVGMEASEVVPTQTMPVDNKVYIYMSVRENDLKIHLVSRDTTKIIERIGKFNVSLDDLDNLDVGERLEFIPGGTEHFLPPLFIVACAELE